MGTRALVAFLNEDNEEFCLLYVQMDGYPEGLGMALAQFLQDGHLVNGYMLGSKAKQFNGMGCLAAQVVAHLKDGVGNHYLMTPMSRDHGEEWIYTIYQKDKKVYMRVKEEDAKNACYDGPLANYAFTKFVEAEQRKAEQRKAKKAKQAKKAD